MLAVIVAMVAAQPASAQLGGALKSLGNKAAGAVQNAAQKGVKDAVQNAQDAKVEKDAQAARSRTVVGKIIYVSSTTGSARADGLTPEKPMFW